MIVRRLVLVLVAFVSAICVDLRQFDPGSSRRRLLSVKTRSDVDVDSQVTSGLYVQAERYPATERPLPEMRPSRWSVTALQEWFTSLFGDSSGQTFEYSAINPQSDAWGDQPVNSTWAGDGKSVDVEDAGTTRHANSTILHCYVCNSHYQPSCDDPFNTSSDAAKTFLLPCTGPLPLDHVHLCRKIRHVIPGDRRVVRYCGHTVGRAALSRAEDHSLLHYRISHNGSSGNRPRQSPGISQQVSELPVRRLQPRCIHNYDFNKRYTECRCFSNGCNDTSNLLANAALVIVIATMCVLFSP